MGRESRVLGNVEAHSKHTSMHLVFCYSHAANDVVARNTRVVGAPKFHSWGKCTMPLTNINSDWMSNAFSGLAVYHIASSVLGCGYFILRGSFNNSPIVKPIAIVKYV